MIVSFSQFTTPGLDGKNEALRVTVPTWRGAQGKRWRVSFSTPSMPLRPSAFLEHRTVLDQSISASTFVG